MEFLFSEDQLLLSGAVRELLEKECTPEHVRRASRDPAGRSPALWRALAEMGVVGLTAPAEHGGMGMDEVDLVLVLEEAGRAALPEPLVSTTAVGIPLLRDQAPEEVRGAWLARAAAGEAILAVGLAETGHVADAHVADLLLLESGDEVHAVPRERARLTPQPSLDPTRHLFRADWEPHPHTRLASGAAARRALEVAFDRGALAAAAELCGVAARVVEMAAAYARQRRQFGRPIGSFQAVKHLLADALMRLEFARPAVYRAAGSVARDTPERARDVSMAKALASDAASFACRSALQVHGAVGYTEEHDLHLWLRRGWALAGAWRDASWHRARVARALLG